jgi:ethanolamine utilization protein
MDKDALIELITKEVMKKIFIKKALLLSEKEYEITNKAFLNGYSLETYKEDVNLDDYDLIVVPELSIENISALALGLPQDNMVGTIIRALFKGKRVIVLKEGLEHRKYKETAKGNLYKLYLDYEVRITALGVEIEGEESKDQSVVTDKVRETTQNVLSKKLITESDLRRFQMKGVKEIAVDKNCIITPLAKDFIRINKIQIKPIS